MTPGDRIALARRRKGWTQQQLADALNTHQVAVSKWESNERPGVKKLPALARVLEVQVAWITVGDHPPEWFRPDQIRETQQGHGDASPNALERIAKALETIANSLQLMDRHLTEKAVRDQARDEYHAETRRVLDEVRAADRRRPPKAAEP